MSEQTTRDPVNSSVLELRDQWGIATLGLITNADWREDPRHLLFSLSRYKFVAKMLSGHERVLEVGCGDGFYSTVVRQEVTDLTITDFDPLFIAEINARPPSPWPMTAKVFNPLEGGIEGRFTAAYLLDVLEHIDSSVEETFLGNVVATLEPHGVMIVGMPSLESQPFASPASKDGHVNCKSAPVLKALMQRFFHNVFIFSMNDEVVHTGYHKMAHYIFALAVDPRRAA